MNAIRRTRIVATLGPATSDPDTVSALVKAGVDVFRVNFSHGSHDAHARYIAAAREAAAEHGRHVAILQDLMGPKIRIGPLPAGPITLRDGARVVLAGDEAAGREGVIPTTYPALAQDVKPGHRVLLDDGLMELRATGTADGGLECEVVHGGELHEHKGVNLPDSRVSAPAFTEKDAADLRFGIEAGVDMVALSFVRAARDGDEARALMREARRRLPLLAKIEKPEALKELSPILRRFDGVMVARGDLGVEMRAEVVPGIQKRIIAEANALGKPVITATQMLQSMIENPRPTRAEASDVANAVLDGTDAVMLSGETAVGRFPLQTVQTMDRIVREAEALGPATTPPELERPTRAYAVCQGAVDLARRIGAVALAAFTRSGQTVQVLSKLRPRAPIFAFCDDEATARRLALWWGVVPLVVSLGRDVDQTTQIIASELRERGFVEAGDDVVVVGASRVNGDPRTNLVRLLHVED